MKISVDPIETFPIIKFRKLISHVLFTIIKPDFFRVDSEKFANNTYGNYFTITHDRILDSTAMSNMCLSSFLVNTANYDVGCGYKVF
jgi:hypothetical protein